MKRIRKILPAERLFNGCCAFCRRQRKEQNRIKKKSMMVAAVSTFCMLAGALTITPTGVRINGSENALYPRYEVSGETPECGALRVMVYDSARTRKYGEAEYYLSELVTPGANSFNLELGDMGLNADDVEDGEPAIYIELSIIDPCTYTPDGPLVLATSGIAYPGNGNSPSSSTLARHYKKARIFRKYTMRHPVKDLSWTLRRARRIFRG